MKISKWIIALTLMGPILAEAQSYVGQIFYRNTFAYVKLVCQDDTCTFSIPYLDRDERFPVSLQNTGHQEWQFTRQGTPWKFKTHFEAGKLTGTLALPSGQQDIHLVEQLGPVSPEDLSSYAGVYSDEQNRRAIIYARFNYLHLMSPYSEESMSLKPIGDKTFWSVSGERSEFSENKNGKYQLLTIHDIHGASYALQRIPDFTIDELWIPVVGDTLYAQLFLPQTDQPAPACLILPGGGAVGMDNYIYEARLFAAHGMAALVFDKAGNGKSKGEGHFNFQTFEETNEQYKTVFRYLQHHPKVDKNKIGVHGPSEGGRIALMMAIDLGADLAFAISVAGPHMTMREGQLFAMDHHHRNLGLRQSDNMKIQEIWNEYYDGILSGEIDPATIEKANVYRSISDRLFLPPNSTDIPISPHKADLENDRTVQEAGKIISPLLLQYGENDQRVDREGSLRNLLPQLAHPERVTTIIYPRGDHSMMTPEYKICTGYTSDKINWLKHIGILPQ